MESQTFSQTVACQFICRQPGLVPLGLGVPTGPQYLVRKIQSIDFPAEPLRPPQQTVRSPVVIDENGDPDDKAAYDGLYPEKSLRLRRFYNIGAGRFWHPYWTNIDRASDRYPAFANGVLSIDVDLMSLEPLPMDDGTAELMYSSHFLEHLPEESVRHVLREACRVLKPDGVFRVTTPDALLEYRAYKERDWAFYSWRDFYSRPGNYEHLIRIPLNQASIQQLFLYRIASHVSTLHVASKTERLEDVQVDALFSSLPLGDALDYCTNRCDPLLQYHYPSNHISWWSSEKMIRALHEAGFREAYRSGYGQSFAPPMRNTRLFDKMIPAVSLYVEARK